MASLISFRLSSLALSLVAGAFSITVAGCTSDSSSDYHHRYGGGYHDYDSARSASERRGDRNTVRSDIQDDGRLNGTARSYEERKASREADEGNYEAARREAELRRERLDR